ncbi:MAG TPA: alpha/beta fold hydrolase [Candidatus Saccharimonadales bacterium]|nr:alpha/beta fold hydrolase [Candidatus Saccharimonadales bacterium]
MKGKLNYVVVAVLLVASLGASGASYWNRHHSNQIQPTQTPRSASQPQATPAPALNPLQIDAIRSRSYPASQLVTETDLGDQGGYHSYIASYTSDGLKIFALLAVPTSPEPAGGWPVIIFNHGYIDPAQYQTASSYRDWVATLARAGFMVVKPDYRGNAGSQGQPEGGHFSPVYAYDVLNLISTLKQYPKANANRIGLFGHSMGGHVSLRTIVASPDVKATVVAAGVVGSFNDIFYNWPNSPAPNDRPLALVQGIRQHLIDQFGTPKTDPDFWNSASAINYVGDITGAVQVHQDIGDTVVPKIFSDHLVRALQQSSKPVEYYLYPGNDHNFTADRSLLMQRAIAFYRSHL